MTNKTVTVTLTEDDARLVSYLIGVGLRMSIGDRSRVARAIEAVLPVERTAGVILFRTSGTFYTEEEWSVPEGATGPYDMDRSPDFHRISDGGAVLVETQEPWGYPHLFPGV